MILKNIRNLIITTLCLHLGGCASSLNPRKQNVTILSTKDSEVFVDDNKIGKGKTLKAKIPRDIRVHQVKIETKGYLPEYDVIYQTKKSPLKILSFVPFGVLLYPMLMDFGPKAYNYEKEFKINPKTKIKEKQPDQKYIYLTNTALDIKKDSLYVENYTHKQFKKNKKTKKVEFSEKEIESSNTIFSNTLNDILKDYGYIDTVQSTLKSRTNSLYIDAKISKIKFKRIRARFHHNAFGNCEIHMEWRLMDVYDQVKFAKTLTVSSGNFASNHNLHGLPSQSKDDPTTYIGKSLQNAITTSFFHFLSLPDVSKILKKDETPIVNYEQLTWKAKQQTQTLKNARNASVSISVDKGHGSGVLISDDGYVITNYHVVAGQSTSEVILNTGEKLKATLIRWSEDDDIALLKIDDTSKRFAFFALPKENNFDLGDEVFAIGTPHSIELSQTLTKGIISGFRKRADNTELIQTDVSVSPGNSGGGLVTPSGQLLGIVGSKIVGRGVEGISFCIPAYQLEKILKLNIEYQ